MSCEIKTKSLRRWNIATQERKIFDVEVEIVTQNKFVKKIINFKFKQAQLSMINTYNFLNMIFSIFLFHLLLNQCLSLESNRKIVHGTIAFKIKGKIY